MLMFMTMMMLATDYGHPMKTYIKRNLKILADVADKIRFFCT